MHHLQERSTDHALQYPLQYETEQQESTTHEHQVVLALLFDLLFDTGQGKIEHHRQRGHRLVMAGHLDGP